MVHFHAVEARRHVRAADRSQRIALELQFRTQQCAFKPRSTGWVANQLIGGAEGVLVERT